MAKSLIVNADDFGASEGVNRGIVECHLHGIVTSTSLMVGRPAAAEAAQIARAHPSLAVGLHFQMPDVPGFDTADKRAVRGELARQLELFGTLLDAQPTHLDSHHHHHRDPGVVDVFRDAAASLDVPLRGDGRVRYVGGFYAQWEWKVTNLHYVSVAFLQGLLRDEVRDGWTELSCHPGYRSPGFSSVYLSEREAEVRTLTDARVRQTLHELDVELHSYADLAVARPAH